MIISKDIFVRKTRSWKGCFAANISVLHFKRIANPHIHLHIFCHCFLCSIPRFFFNGGKAIRYRPPDMLLQYFSRQPVATPQDFQYFRKTDQGAGTRTRRDVPLLHNGISPRLQSRQGIVVIPLGTRRIF